MALEKNAAWRKRIFLSYISRLGTFTWGRSFHGFFFLRAEAHPLQRHHLTCFVYIRRKCAEVDCCSAVRRVASLQAEVLGLDAERASSVVLFVHDESLRKHDRSFR